MTSTILGAETVAAVVADAFRARVPAALADLAQPTALGPLARLDDPKLYATSDRFRLELPEYPAVLVVPQGAGQVIPLDFDDDDGGEVWRFRYTLRTFTFVRGRSYEEVAAYRNRLMAALRVAIFRRWQLTDDIAFVPPADGTQYRESLSEAGVDRRDQRSVAGGYIEHQVDALEGASIPTLGVANTVDATLLPLD